MSSLGWNVLFYPMAGEAGSELTGMCVVSPEQQERRRTGESTADKAIAR
ncbi:MAG: hypothetical protein HQ581_20705 [Planctomycetes bacterium]|nr:hypothetical protein [Planctomycetota bacterium]